MMKKQYVSLLAVLLLAASVVWAQKPPQVRIPVAFYNLENLFDTTDQSNDDAEFLPEGRNMWTQERYLEKSRNMARVISQIAGHGPAILGVAEVENRGVLEDLVANPLLKNKGYAIVHYDSPDLRGIDCAILYQPSVFKLISHGATPVASKEFPELRTRDVVHATGLIAGEVFHILVAHWPSRSGGEKRTIPLRMLAANTMRGVADSLQQVYPGSKVIMMGDFNDDPVDKSLRKGIGIVSNPSDMKPTQYFSPMLKMYKKGEGTLAYRDVWSLFDIMVVNGALMNAKPHTLTVEKDPKTGYYAHIFKKDYLMQSVGQYRGYPQRTSVGGAYKGGYSDHFPVYLFLVPAEK